MKILYITYETPCFPGGNGGQTRQYCILKELSKRHVIHFIGKFATGDELASLKKICAKVSLSNKKNYITKIISILHQLTDNKYPKFVLRQEWLLKQLYPLIIDSLNIDKYDVIHVEHTNIAHWLHGIDTKVPKLLVAQNVKSVMWERYADQAQGKKKIDLRDEQLKFNEYESTFFKDYNAIAATSSADREFVRQLCPSASIAVVPNGVDIEYFSPEQSQEITPGTLVFTGSMSHPPNEEAVLFFCKEILPKVKIKYPGVRIVIVGNSPSRKVRELADDKKIIVTGFVDDTRPYIASAAVVVVPLLSGSGTRLKILEAMAMKKAIVSTHVGAEGIDYTDGHNIILANDPDSFANRVVELLSDKKRCDELGGNARELVQGKYSWAIVARQLEKVYLDLATNYPN